MQPYTPSRGGPAGPRWQPVASLTRTHGVGGGPAAPCGGGATSAAAPSTARSPPPPPPSHPTTRRAALSAAAALLFTARPATAHIETARLLSGSATASGTRAGAGAAAGRAAAARPPPPATLLDDLATARRSAAAPPPPPPRPGSSTTPSSSSSVASKVAAFRGLTAAAEAAAAAGDWAGAEAAYGAAIASAPDLAIADLARISRALVLRQLGDAGGARLALEDVEAGLRGRAEVHAALAALRAEARLPGAEAQWELACEFDSRFGDLGWVARERRWPPAMVGALRAFLELK